MKILIAILGLINGSYMLIDGIYVMYKGKFIGPEKPGPWANIFYKFDMNVFKLGPLFILFGVLWLAWVYSLWTSQPFAYLSGLGISILSLWYLPFGTIFSMIIIAVLLLARQKIGG